MIERYYGIRIGIPKRHYPYLMLEDGKQTPAIFLTKEEALNYQRSHPDMSKTAQVMRVRIAFGKPGED